MPVKEVSKLKSLQHVIEFQISQTVYLRTDTEQNARLITGIQLRPFNSVMYGVSQGTTESWHFGFELSDERDIIMVTSN
jgi:hypothetical protein